MKIYLRARALAERQGVADPSAAASIFEKIIASDPGFARAHAGLVLAYAYLSLSPYQGVPFEKAHTVMRTAAVEAVRLDPLLAEAQAARGWVHAREFEWVEAERAFRRAIELNPGLIFSYTSFSFSTLQPLGRVADAERMLREAERIDPFATEVQLALARVLHQAGRASESIAVLERLRVADSAMPFLDLLMGRALALDGRAARIPAPAGTSPRTAGRSGRPACIRGWRGPMCKLGRRADAERLARDDDRLPFRRAIINAALGNTDRMFDGLRGNVRPRAATSRLAPPICPNWPLTDGTNDSAACYVASSSRQTSLSEGLRPSDSPTRALARRCAGALRSRGSLAVLARFLE